MILMSFSQQTQQSYNALSVVEKSELNTAFSFIYDYRICPNSKKEKSSENVERIALQLKAMVHRTDISHLPNFYNHYSKLAQIITNKTNSFDWSFGNINLFIDCFSINSASKKYRRLISQTFIQKKHSNFLTNTFVTHQFQMWKKEFFENLKQNWIDQTYVGDAKQSKKKSKKSGGASSSKCNSFPDQYRSRIKEENQFKPDHFLSISGATNDKKCHRFRIKNKGYNLALLYFDSKRLHRAQARYI